jgi:hypothetical protein
VPSVIGKIVFVSSLGTTGSIGGISGADAHCQGRAVAAGLSGTYKAWLSADSYSTSPASRFTKSTGPYVLVTGTMVADSWSDLTDGTIDHAIDRTEFGALTGFSWVWSFTRTDGSQGLFGDPVENCYGGDCHCHGWTSTATQGSPTPGSAVAIINKTNDDWTDYSFGNFCGSTYSLYCFQQ